ncbi:hypothetical protein ASPZODRAFT_127775 [Penicilliopsis zonata CBS 506.65]|uniref:FAD-binding PCMH-type domain-containing protein n=1 Tax=Penicilliopsis zonata CBS 506.65 TaxID=1073090 RepID=A0A1L9SWW8_9EURO|nr:hypothetical protein ASPZODRAFT_127775 [Penicilliopsis zonata CBS 506.65]OJJ51659.1 hypothetical protein ASPZODRAFT_127775 [Penicilliopsis zonata CBS 506.65]
MASPLAALQAFLHNHPDIKCTTPSAAEYPSISEIWNVGHAGTPLAIVHPQSADDVCRVIRYARTAGLRSTIRTGGHNLVGSTMVEGALVIDLRALAGVAIAADRQSVTIGGGILQGELAKKLWEEGLATPTGTVPSVGYVGWAMYGGYGPFSGNWGLGVDQILHATLVNAEGEIVKADARLLRGIRGAGGMLGVIVDLTVKVYPLKQFLAGSILFESQDIKKTFTEFNAAYRQILNDGLPPALTIQQAALNAPTGRVFGVIFAWSSDDVEEGQRWREKIAGLGNPIMNTVAVVDIPTWLAGNQALVASSGYGFSHSGNLYRITPEVTETIGRNLAQMPFDPATMFVIHPLRGPSAAPREDSVFASREPHFMLEILGFAVTKENRQAAEQWAAQTAREIHDTDPGNLLPTAYISLYHFAEPVPLAKFFGTHVKEILALKEEYDPHNVYNLPRLQS